ncbi:MAG: mannose-1-phosphate guanylyltransferase [Anaerolineales bacterium]|nr:mannose-1-phosphate guanylyltransferase [Anaerolineales bacterium]MCZ2123695.1 NTP transferase domain-containing protein [Anaerolineales bacterium]
MSEHHYAVIMAGGGGTRLWPVSRKEKPKQLLPLLGEDTLFQSTVARLKDLFPPERILVVTVEEQAREMREQAPQIPAENYLIEPSPRGTASVVGLAAMVLKKRDSQAAMAILPSDHFIRNVDLFHYLLKAAFDVAENGYLVTLGITPTLPSTAYGYIQQGKPLDGNYKYPVYTAESFKEKPNEQTAQQLLRMGDHSWNSGMFIWRADTILNEIGKQMPDLSEALNAIGETWDAPERIETLNKLWPQLKNETVDYGIMENSERVAVLPAGGLGWSDVGSWSSLFEVLLPDMNGNISTNSALHLPHETHNTLVYGGHDRLIVTIGVDDMVIIDTGDALLVCKTDQSQRVKEVVEHLRKHRQENFL